MSNMQKRCDLCGLFQCRHVRDMEYTTGDSLDDVLKTMDSMSEFVSPRDQDGLPVRDTEPKIRVDAAPKRQIIPPPPRVQIATQPVGTKIDINKDDTGFVVCNLCKSNIARSYLNMHMKGHTSSIEKKTSVALVPRPIDTKPMPQTITTKPKQTIKSVEVYRFKKIETACAAATVSNNRRYSDFTCVLWLEPKLSSYGGHYAGGHVSYSKEQERLIIHAIYDSLEEYYTISCKILERSSFGTFDREAGVVPDRVCYQEDVMVEIKKMLLFLNVSPKAAYKHFRLLFKQDIITEANKAGSIYIAQTANSIELTEKLKKPADNNSNRYGNVYQGHGYFGGDGE